MPILMITYGIQYSDKITLSSSVAFDLRQDTHLVGNEFAWLSTGFYLAYLIAELPFGWVMQKFPMEKVISYTVLGWGICVFGLAACNNFTQLMAIRTLLGILEAPISPGFLIIVTAWYKREEQLLRSMMFFSMNSFFSLFILMANYGVGKAAIGSKIESWRAIHLFLGAVSFLWGIILYFTLCAPKSARWLSQGEKTLAHARLVSNKTGESTSGIKFKWNQLWECFVDPQIYFIMLTTILKSSASGGFSTFSTIILQSFNLNTEQTIVYQLPWYAIQFVSVCVVSYVVNTYPGKNLNLIMAFTLLLPAVVGIFLEALLNNDHLWGRLVGFWITGFYTPASFIIWSTTGLNVAGRTKKSCAQAITFMAFCAGYCIGPQMFYASSAPQYRPGLYFCSACFFTAELLIAVWYVWVRWENRRRDKKAEAQGLTLEQRNLEGCLLGLQDITDRENPHFRYRY
ncbi:MFS general substrate transporter [Hypoxylon rubiginosum]|uniref:MFS general substrate transporter n=1 Tax=Hypoxylon rubiginosum TaxID=110542 RepID=A0ACC0D7V4_9PEZI|nr:MFS general substrate transporter [Hypoxylon rubiginosum]